MEKTLLEWERPAWQAEAKDWIRASLDKKGIKLQGEIEQPHIRPWSTILQVPTDRGNLFFKASAPYFGSETAVTEYLTRFRPELFPELIATDIKKNWMLMADAGVPLRHFVRGEKSFARWKDIMPLFVQLQKDLASHTLQLLSLGVMDRRLEVLPEKFERLVADEKAMLIGQEEGLSPEQYSDLTKQALEFRRLCEQLRSAGIPETIHHDDFHDANIFLKDGLPLFTDWGESAIAHPFFTLVVMLRGVGNSLEAFSEEGFEAGPDTPEVVEIREMYLKDWTEFGTMEELTTLASIAERKLGYANRAITWHHSIENLPEELQPEYAGAVPAYMQEYLQS